MKSAYTGPLLKSFIAFATTYLYDVLRTFASQIWLTPNLQTSIENAYTEINNNQLSQENSLQQSIDEASESLIEILYEHFERYVQFLLVMIILEILYLIFLFIKKAVQPNEISYLSPQNQQTGPIYRTIRLILRESTVNFCKGVFISSICYFLYITFVTVLSFPCHGYAQQEILPHTGLSLNGLNSQDAEANSSAWGLKNTQRYLAYEFSTTPLSSVTGQFILTNSPGNFPPMSAIFSNDSNIAFICTGFDTQGNYSFEIVNIIDFQSLNVLGSIHLTLTQQQMSNLEYSGQTIWSLIVLSPDEQTVYLTVGPELLIINASNWTNPILLNSSVVADQDQGNFISLELSPDGETLFMATNGNYFFILSIENPMSPSLLYSQLISDFSGTLELHIHGDSLFLGTSSRHWQIFNISNPTHLSHIESLTIPGSDNTSLLSVTFSSDYQIAYAWFVEHSCFCSIINITNLAAPTIITQANFDIVPTGFIISRNDRYFFLTGDYFLQVLDFSNLFSPVLLSEIAIPKPINIVVSPNGQKALVMNYEQFFSVELYFNVQSSQMFDLQNSRLDLISQANNDSVAKVNSIALSPDESTLYISSGLHDNPSSSLAVFNVSDPSSIEELPSFALQQAADQVIVSSDGKTLFMTTSHVGEQGPTMLMIYDIKSKNLLSSFFIAGDVNCSAASFALATDGNTAFLVARYDNSTSTAFQIVIIDVSNRSQPSLISNTLEMASSTDYRTRISLSKDDKTAFITGGGLQIFDISNLSSPILLNQTYNDTSKAAVYTISSLDSSIAFTTVSETDQYFLDILNISSRDAPTLISRLDIPWDEDSDSDSNLGGGFSVNLMELSPDGSTLYVAAGGLTVINVSNLSSPSFLGSYNADPGVALQVSPGGETAFLGVYETGVIVINLQSDYILYLPRNSFVLGETYFSTLNVLAKNPSNTYDANLVNYKFIGLALYEVVYEVGYASSFYNYTALPNWINFDSDTGGITLTPNSKYHAGPYSIYGALSKQIDNSLFLGIANITTLAEATQLMSTLIGLGYLDNQGYLTSKFNPNQPLAVGSQALPNETDIRTRMSDYYIEAVGQIYVNPSLVLNLEDPLLPNPKISVSTLSLSPLNLNITLGTTDNVAAQFVKAGYSLVPLFMKNQTSMNVVGSLFDINTVFSELIIFLHNQNSSDGTITISDGLNPPIVQNVSNISAYFRISSQPSINASYFQFQVSQVSISTGNQFIIQFDYSTFSDPEGEDLTYCLAMQDSTLQVPDWLILRGLDLIGTPPEEFTDREIKLTMIASNQYQSSEVDFTLYVDISWFYALKLVSSIGGALITMIGLIFYASRIYNVLCKSMYRYPKDFTVRVGEEITCQTIYPIAFIAEPLRESKFIIQQIDKRVKAESKTNSKAKIAVYFMLTHVYQIDQVKLMQYVEEVVSEILEGNNADKLKHYASQVNPRKELIHKLIIKEMTMRLIGLEEVKPTKSAFRRIKGSLFGLVELENVSEDGVCEFAVTRSKLHKKLQELNIKVSLSLLDRETKMELSDMKKSGSIVDAEEQEGRKLAIKSAFLGDKKGIKSTRVNIELLIDLIEAYVFRHHNLDATLAHVEVHPTERLVTMYPPKMIRRFLKKDLQPVTNIVKGKQIGYGIDYEAKNGFLRFSGTPIYEIKDKKIVVQIMNMRGRILREIWLNGESVGSERESLKSVAVNE